MGWLDFWRRPKRQQRRSIPVTASVLNSVDDRQNAAYFTTAQDNSADRLKVYKLPLKIKLWALLKAWSPRVVLSCFLFLLFSSNLPSDQTNWSAEVL